MKDLREHHKTQGATRSKEWPKVRREHLKKFPTCAVCGGKKKIQVHHVKPFHLHPQLELDPNNLITVCEADGHDCHLAIAHLGSFKSWNVDIVKDANYLLTKRLNRPM